MASLSIQLKRELVEFQYSDYRSYYRPWLKKYSATGYLEYREPSYKSSFGDPNWQGREQIKECADFDVSKLDWTNRPCVLIVFPCLEVRTKGSWRYAKQTFWSRRKNMTNAAKGMIHLERTLDETWCPGLHEDDLETRNDDQVISKEYRKMKPELIGDREPLLLVPQLWLLRFGDHLISAFPEESFHSFNSATYLGKYGRISEYPNAIRMGLVIASHISSFDEPAMGIDGEEFHSPLLYFEMSVNGLLSEVERYTDPSKPSQPEIQKERDFMRNVDDIRDELNMIKRTLRRQDEILGSLIEEFEKFEWYDLQHAPDRSPELPKWKHGWEKVKLSRGKIKEYQERVEEIERNAERIRGVIQEQLNLKRTHASIRDARTGLVLSAAVIGFTVITIIFAPLAFMTSLFALPLDSFLGNQYQFPGASGTDSDPDPGPTAVYTTQYIAKWFTVAEVVTLIATSLLVILCFWLFGVADISAMNPKSFLKNFFNIFKNIFQNIAKELEEMGRKLLNKRPNKKTGIMIVAEKDQLGPDQKATGFRGIINEVRRRIGANELTGAIEFTDNMV
ncbi:hypothetical protein F4821DRAFT_230746 [Hypoxylon rubiginosum]|uniref:Uncharacterized protein n=1 Tax=Hypoxylon rubiginosum TaxID=110542 RepID=A0ACC0DAL2_9PEZI|nr:hypothetical protein F4821DRAFT_230746 [Hypoxylon rubiginosum]